MIDKIFQTTCQKWGVSLNDVCSRNRKREFVFTRMTIAYFLRMYTSLSTTEIGRLINRDHTAILYYLKTYDSEFRFNEVFRNFAESIKEELEDAPKTPFAREMEEEFNEIRG